MADSNNCNFLQYCVVQLSVPNSPSRGTGFLVAPHLILTCYHVVEQAKTVEVLYVPENCETQATVKDTVPNADLALLELPKALVAENILAALGTAYQSRDPFYTFGYPDRDFPDGAPVTAECEGEFQENGISLIKFKAGQIRPGLSGSPLYNQRTGQICGVVKFTLNSSIDLGGGAIPLSHCPESWQHDFTLQPEPPARTPVPRISQTQTTHLQDISVPGDNNQINIYPTQNFYQVPDSSQKQQPTPTPNNLHSRGVPREQFFGRDEKLQQLHQILQSQKEVAITAAVVGMGGIGKTELAVQYARQFQDSYPGGICFLDSLNWKQELVSFARIYFPDFDPPDDLELDELVAYCWQHWQPSEGNVLVILDNLTDYQQIKALRPEDSRFALLLTTRENLGITQLPLEELSDAAARDLLAYFVSDHRLEASEQVQKLCRKLGNLPLGIELVGRYLQTDPDVSLAEMLERLEAQALEDEALEEVHSAMTATRGVRAALALSWQRLSEPTQVVAAWLALLAEASFPWWLVERMNAAAETSFFHDKQLRTARRELTQSHLLKRMQEKTYALHPLVREFLQEKLAKLPEAQATEYKRAYCRALVKELKQIEQTPLPEQIRAVTPILPHAEVATWEMTDCFEKADIYQPFVCIGRFYQGQGFYADAEPWLQQGCRVAEQYLEAQHTHLAASYNNLAGLYQDQGKYDDAEPLYLQAIQIREQSLPPSHPALANSYNNLARLYQDQGKYDDAEPLYLKTIQILKQSLPPSHPHLATSYHNLAALYRTQGKLNDAESLYLKTIQIYEQALPPSHPDLASSYNNLAGLYQDQGKHDDAEPLYLKAVQIREQSLPPSHPHLASSYNNLAGLYEAQGKYDDAEPLYLQAIQIREQSLPPSHPALAASYNNLAGLYQDQGKYDDAEPLYLQAIQIREQSLPPSHPALANSYNNLARLYQDQGKYDDAEPLYLKTIQILKQSLPPSHPHLATSYHNLAALYRTQGKLNDAESLYLKTIQIYEQALPPSHPHLADSYNNLALLYFTQGKYDDAEPLLLKTIQIYEQALPPSHPQLADSYNNLALLYFTQGKYDDAEPLLLKTIQIYEQALPPSHPHLADSYNNLAGLYFTQGKYDDAEPLLLKAWQIREETLGAEHPDTLDVKQGYEIVQQRRKQQK
jgi:tetratricopeptide (TPR) repeat protein